MILAIYTLAKLLFSSKKKRKQKGGQRKGIKERNGKKSTEKRKKSRPVCVKISYSSEQFQQ